MVIWDRDRGFGSDPFGELERFRRRMNRIFGVSPGFMTQDVFPPLNVWSDSGKAVVKAEVPGIKKEDLEISVENDVLTIKGHREPGKPGGGECFRRHERGHGSFRRAIGLPFSVDPENVTADYCNGILRLELPRHETSKPKKIEVG